MGLSQRIRQQAFDTAQAFGKGDEPDAFKHGLGEFRCLDLEGNHAAVACSLALLQGMSRMRRQADIVDVRDIFLRSQPFGNLQGVLAWRSTRMPSVLMLRSSSQESMGERFGPSDLMRSSSFLP